MFPRPLSVLTLVAAVTGAACSNSSGPRDTGALELTVTTTGTNPDLDGYTVQVDNQGNQAIPSNGSVTVVGISVGNHNVSLGGIATNCLVTGTYPLSVAIAAGDTAQAAMAVLCSPIIGSSGDLVGVWDWTEHFADATQGVTCDDTGTYVFVVAGAGFTGRSDQVGTCATPSGPIDNTSSDTLTDGAANSGSMSFTIGANAACQYVGHFSGTTDRLTGTAVCGSASGTWTADRGLAVTSLTLVPDSTTVPQTAVFPLTAKLLNSLGNRTFRAVTWASDAPTVVSVDSLGWVEALQAGVAHIQASTQTFSDAAAITVGGTITFDPVGDTYGATATPQMDVVSLSAAADSSAMTVAVRFTNPFATPFYGWLDLDVDQNGATGAEALVDVFRPDTTVSSGLGDEFVCNLANGDLYDAVTTNYLGTVLEFYDPLTSTLVVRLPVSILGSAVANLAVVVGNGDGPTDVVPDADHLSLGAAAVSPVTAGSAPLRRLAFPWRGLVRATAPVRPRRGKIP